MHWKELLEEVPIAAISLRSILILSSHLRLGLPKSLFPEGVPVKILKAFHSGYMTCPPESSRFNHPGYIR